MGFLSFFTFCVRLRCVLFFSCTIKVPFLIKIVYQNGTSRLIIYKNPPLVKPFFKFFRHLCTEKVKSPTLQVHCVTPQSKQLRGMSDEGNTEKTKRETTAGS